MNLLAPVITCPVTFFAAVLARRLRLVARLACSGWCLQALLCSKSLEVDLEQLVLAVWHVVFQIARLQEDLGIFVLLRVVADTEELQRGFRRAQR